MWRRIRDILRSRLPAQTLGARGETVAAHHLRAAGYRVLKRNARTRIGEVDIVAQAPDGRTIVIVEVKTGTAHDIPAEVHVNRAKQRKLASLAQVLVRRHRWQDRPIRFDVIGIELRDDEQPIVRHHVAAFESHV